MRHLRTVGARLAVALVVVVAAVLLAVYLIVLGTLLVTFALFARDGLVGLLLQKRRAGAA